MADLFKGRFVEKSCRFAERKKKKTASLSLYNIKWLEIVYLDSTELFVLLCLLVCLLDFWSLLIICFY